LAFLVIPSAVPDPTRSLRLGGIALLFAVFNIPGYLLARPGTAQTLDLKVYVLISGMTLNALVELIKLSCGTEMGFGWSQANLHPSLARIIPATWRNQRFDVSEDSG
jgi:hypothetical protein